MVKICPKYEGIVFWAFLDHFWVVSGVLGLVLKLTLLVTHLGSQVNESMSTNLKAGTQGPGDTKLSLNNTKSKHNEQSWSMGIVLRRYVLRFIEPKCARKYDGRGTGLEAEVERKGGS
ncbi:hypothetical protein BJ165DRAFT_1397417 [Panaeolus papilionaceus]|nr:hypothetical protein BJ165DRAFT_1397417 [Panaeolus papilionaceus]